MIDRETEERTRRNCDCVGDGFWDFQFPTVTVAPPNDGAIIAQRECVPGAGRNRDDFSELRGLVGLAVAIVAPRDNRSIVFQCDAMCDARGYCDDVG